MKKFSKIIENIEGKKYFKIDAQIQLIIPAENEGEASYKADSSLASLKNQSNYTISNIEETNELLESTYGGQPYIDQEDDRTPEEIIKASWDAEFGSKIPTSTEKLEFYHNLRRVGFDGTLIHKVLKDKLLGN